MHHPSRSGGARARLLLRLCLAALVAAGCHVSRADETDDIGSLEKWFAPAIAETPIPSEGFWFDIEAWGARTTNCFGTDSMACMACSMNTPAFATRTGTAPIGVSNNLWFEPSRAATCGMCLRVYMDTDEETWALSNGTRPYFRNVEQPWAYNTTIRFDEGKRNPWTGENGTSYFEAIVVEWFDREQRSGNSITYPAYQQPDINKFGTWRIALEPVACRVEQDNLTFSFVDFRDPHPERIPEGSDSSWLRSGSSEGALPTDAATSLCDNEDSKPCGNLTRGQDPLPFVKLKVAGSRYPIGAVTMTIDAADGALPPREMNFSGDGFWQASSANLTAEDDLTFKITCLDGPATVTHTVQPAKCFCEYQDPQCQPCTSQVQCPVDVSSEV